MDTRESRPEGSTARHSGPPSPDRTGRPLVSARDRFGLAALALERARRGTLARVRRSRLLRWQHRSPIARDLLLAPPDLRPQDPCFAEEIESGSFGLCGQTADLRDGSPFTVRPPSQAWARELHAFGWLRHFGAAWSPANETTARRLVREWIAGRRRHSAEAWAPEVVGQRIVAWLSHAQLILDGAQRRPTRAVMLSLEDQATYLSASWRNAPSGHPRLLALIGLTQAALCIAGHERRLGAVEPHLVEQIERQVLADGGHITRNPGVLVELLLDLLPLRQCFVARSLTPPQALTEAIARMLPMLNRLRLGDGQLARFNGMGATERDALATVIAYDKGTSPAPEPVSPSRYARLERGGTVVVVDAGSPPALELSGQACGGCLSFEVSAGADLVLVNGGTPGPAHARNALAARGTASHNTLVLNGEPSSKLVRDEGLQSGGGPVPIRYPDRVTAEVSEASGTIRFKGSHDGYVDRFNLVHTRTLSLAADGRRLVGIDTLSGAKSELRFAYDVPFAVHFHLHPRCGARLAADGSAELILPGGERWRLSASGAALSIEESTHYAEVIGPLQAQQVVLRAVCYGAADVRWVLEQTGIAAETASDPASDLADLLE
jgi:uncharacterized heparinase superfamily protein